MDAGLWSPRRPHADSRLRADARGRDGDRLNAVLAGAGYNFILLLRWRNALSSGMLTTRFLFPKFFPKKFGQKPTGNFGNGLCAGPVLLHPAPSFVQMKNTPGGPSRGAGFQARYSARA